jgi:hypothetical protein
MVEQAQGPEFNLQNCYINRAKQNKKTLQIHFGKFGLHHLDSRNF